MSRRLVKFWSFMLATTLALSGCHPTQPFYLHEDGDLSHYLDVAQQIEYPDVHTSSLAESTETREPLSVANPNFDDTWDMTLQEAICITLHNSKVMRTFRGRIARAGQATATGPPDSLTSGAEFIPTIYDPALTETSTADPLNGGGVEAALAEFDAQLSHSLVWDRSDRRRNLVGVQAFASQFDYRDSAIAQIELSKRAATGTRFAIRNNLDYSYNKRRVMAVEPLASIWGVEWEVEARHPLLQGGGTQVNRIPIVIARINSDLRLADFELGVIDTISDVENAYWELHCGYRNLAAVKRGRDSTHSTWKKVNAQTPEFKSVDKEAQARQRYFQFRARTQSAQNDLFKLENRLRYIMGLAATDGRLIRPVDEPTKAYVNFDWREILCESLQRRVELRQQRWSIKQQELKLIAARNLLLPRLDVMGLYRFVGVGDHLINADRNGLDLPSPGSTAYDVLNEGNYQEFQFGLEFSLPVGFRRELAGVRHQQLQCVREKARLEDMELEVTHQLTDAIQNLEGHVVLAQTNFNHWAAAEKEVETVQNAYDTGPAGTVTLDLLLDAQVRRVQAEIDYHRSVCDYNLAISGVHLRKGSLLQYNGTQLAEGPWPEKAYWDAHGLARQRDASYYLDYGFTRPKVISHGAHPQSTEPGIEIHDGGWIEHDVVLGPPEPRSPVIEESHTATREQPTPTAVDGLELKMPSIRIVAEDTPIDRISHTQPTQFKWGSLGLDSSDGRSAPTVPKIDTAANSPAAPAVFEPNPETTPIADD